MFANISPKERKIVLLALGGVAVLLVVLAFLHKRAQAAGASAGLAAGPVSAPASGAPPVQPAPDSFVDISSNTNSFNQVPSPSGFTSFSNFDMAPVPPGVAAMRANGHSLGVPPMVLGGPHIGMPANPAPRPGQPTVLGPPRIATRALG